MSHTPQSYQMGSEVAVQAEAQGLGNRNWRQRGDDWLQSDPIQRFIVAVIVLNAIVLGIETAPGLDPTWKSLLRLIDRLCLAVFLVELAVRLTVQGRFFWKSGWNGFDFFVVAVALVPGAGPWSVLRSLRVLRILRLLTAVPQMRKVVAAFLHAIPGLFSVVAVMGIFFYTAGVLSTNLFGKDFPDWFGTLGKSLFTLFQIMTLESWSMGVVRPVMDVHPWAWAFFVPFIVIATFTILNLFIGIIVSTMQELATMPEPKLPARDAQSLIERMESDLQDLKKALDTKHSGSGEKV